MLQRSLSQNREENSQMHVDVNLFVAHKPENIFKFSELPIILNNSFDKLSIRVQRKLLPAKTLSVSVT